MSSKTDSSTGTVTSTLTEYKYSQTPKSYDISAVGMYADNDDDGKTYYYRGSVAGNYVKFAGFYWRVIRVNGDGTVRLIYDGTTPHDLMIMENQVVIDKLERKPLIVT